MQSDGFVCLSAYVGACSPGILRRLLFSSQACRSVLQDGQPWLLLWQLCPGDFRPLRVHERVCPLRSRAPSFYDLFRCSLLLHSCFAEIRSQAAVQWCRWPDLRFRRRVEIGAGWLRVVKMLLCAADSMRRRGNDDVQPVRPSCGEALHRCEPSEPRTLVVDRHLPGEYAVGACPCYDDLI